MSCRKSCALNGLHAWYGESHILHGVDLSVNQGEVVTLLGRNGAGRTTTLRAIMGLTGSARARSRSMAWRPSPWPPHRIAHLGMGYCPEERGIFSSLSAKKTCCCRPSWPPAA
jgi:branched-chain amino acid transport system ATP-binding protein